MSSMEKATTRRECGGEERRSTRWFTRVVFPDPWGPERPITKGAWCLTLERRAVMNERMGETSFLERTGVVIALTAVNSTAGSAGSPSTGQQRLTVNLRILHLTH